MTYMKHVFFCLGAAEAIKSLACEAGDATLLQKKFFEPLTVCVFLHDGRLTVQTRPNIFIEIHGTSKEKENKEK